MESGEWARLALPTAADTGVQHSTHQLPEACPTHWVSCLDTPSPLTSPGYLSVSCSSSSWGTKCLPSPLLGALIQPPASFQPVVLGPALTSQAGSSWPGTGRPSSPGSLAGLCAATWPSLAAPLGVRQGHYLEAVPAWGGPAPAPLPGGPPELRLRGGPRGGGGAKPCALPLVTLYPSRLFAPWQLTPRRLLTARCPHLPAPGGQAAAAQGPRQVGGGPVGRAGWDCLVGTGFQLGDEMFWKEAGPPSHSIVDVLRGRKSRL